MTVPPQPKQPPPRYPDDISQVLYSIPSNKNNGLNVLINRVDADPVLKKRVFMDSSDEKLYNYGMFGELVFHFYKDELNLNQTNELNEILDDITKEMYTIVGGAAPIVPTIPINKETTELLKKSKASKWYVIHPFNVKLDLG